MLCAKRQWVIAFLIFMACGICIFAKDGDLMVGKAREGALREGKPCSFTLTLETGDFAQLNLDPRGKEVVVLSYDPASHRFRGAKIGPGQGAFDFIAERAGAYRIDISAEDKTADGMFTITLEKIVAVSARLAPGKPRYESPRIAALRTSLASGKPESVNEFWEEIQKQGTPLIEPLAGDNENMLVTFLWRGAPGTQNVFVARLPYAAAMPDDYYMKCLGETDVWYASVATDRKTRFTYRLAPNLPPFRGVAYGIDNDMIAMFAAAVRPDPLNPKRWRVDPQSVDAPEYLGDSMVEMPDAPAQPWLTERPGIMAGQVEKRQFESEMMKNEREIAVYLPPEYSKSAKAYPLLVLFDEQAYVGDANQAMLVPTPTILDNLIAARRIPTMLALFVGNAPGARGRELPCNAAFSDFLVSELLPWAHGLYNFTSDPRRVVIGGSSFGGLAATCASLRHSETFGNVLSQSGSYWWTPENPENSSATGHGAEPNWVAKQFIASPKLALRFYLDAGSEEVDFSGKGDSILLTNRNLRDVLLAKGYEVHFQVFAGGHDYLSWRGTLADGLITLLGSEQ
ncbi:MAG: enterochelin esterase [Candidatus Acidiferrum sp.]